MSAGARVVAAVIKGIRDHALRPSPESSAWCAPDMTSRTWRPHRGVASPIGAVLAGRSVEGGEHPLSPGHAFMRCMRVDEVFLKALCDAYDGRCVYVDLIGDESYAEGAAAGLALRDILFPG